MVWLINFLDYFLKDGKTLPIHFERENIQGDGLID